MEIRYLQPDGLVWSPAVSPGAVVSPGATMIYIGGQNGRRFLPQETTRLGALRLVYRN
jgi:hypothetical protein